VRKSQIGVILGRGDGCLFEGILALGGVFEGSVYLRGGGTNLRTNRRVH